METAWQGGDAWGTEVGPFVASDLPFLSTLLLALPFLLFAADRILLFFLILLFFSV